MKECITCSCLLTDNNWTTTCKLNYVNKCKDCISIEKKAYQKRWREKNRELCVVRAQQSKAKVRLENPMKSRASDAYSNSRTRAKKQGMSFDLTSAYVLSLLESTPICPYFGYVLTYTVGDGKTLASLDRIDSSKGYTQDNVQIISYFANLMKSSATQEELVLFAKGILKIKV
jgi:hypothetical protein